ncbi:hypothetical protein ACFE04_024129 [Oxalis oulophora]
MCFCGVRPIAISATKIVKRVYAIDLNPQTVDYIEMNSVLKKLESKIEIYNMDERRFINTMLTSDKVEPITHVVINLPNDVAEFLDIVSALILEYIVMGVVVLAVVMCFCGVGPIVITATKIVKRVYAIDLNPQAVDYIEMNSVLNKIESKIEIYNMDGRRFINAMLTSDKEVIKLFQTHHKFSKMARQTDLLKKIDFTRSDWCVHVRVVRIWEPLFGKQQFPSLLELVVMDSEGTRMLCTVPQLMIKLVKMKVKENGVYVLQNFFVGLSTVKPNQTRVSTQKYKINFQQNTSIIATDDHDFPPTQFHIRSCADVLNRNRVNEVNLIGQMIITNTRHSETKMWINSDISVINDFKKSLSGDDGDASSQLITTVSSTQSEILVDDLMSSPVRSIEELLTLEERNGVTWDAENVQRLLEKMVTSFIVGLAIHTKLRQMKAPISVIIWDRECFQIYGKTANEMKETKDGNVSSFPTELELICGRKFLFKIHKKSATNSSGELTYHVMKITDDKNLLTKFVISPSGGVSDEKPYVTAEETPCSKESVGDTISKDCTPAKRLFPTPAMDDDNHNASATKVPNITFKVDN